MVLIGKYSTHFPLSLPQLLPLILLLCVTACGGKKDLASQPLKVTPNERIVPSSVPNEPPIIILSPSAENAAVYKPTHVSSTQTRKRKTSAANYSTNNVTSSQGEYAVQIGAFSSDELANRAAQQARRNVPSLLSSTKTHIDTISKNGGALYRVKLTGLDENTASQACSELREKQIACLVTQ